MAPPASTAAASSPPTPTRRSGARMLKQTTLFDASPSRPPHQHQHQQTQQLQSPTPAPTTAMRASRGRPRTRTLAPRAVTLAAASRSNPRRSSSPRTTLREPYEQHSYVELRQECVRRQLQYNRRQSGEVAPQTKAHFVEVLQEADLLAQYQKNAGRPAVTATPRAAAKAKAKAKTKRTSTSPATPLNRAARSRSPGATPATQTRASVVTPPSPVTESAAAVTRVTTRAGLPVTRPRAIRQDRAVRVRRSCRFRLVNVLLSPDFNSRWAEMLAPAEPASDVNDFWARVHVAFLGQHSFYDKVHFENELFANVTPHVILQHSASKLQQVWQDIVTVYRRAVTNSRERAVGGQHDQMQLFKFCAGRLDVLYLHMGLVLAPALNAFVLNERIKSSASAARNARAADQSMISASGTESMPVPKRAKVQKARRASSGGGVVATLPSSGSISQQEDIHSTVIDNDATAKRTEDVNTSEPLDDQEKPVKTAHRRSPPAHGPRFVELKNPEMLPDWLIEDQTKAAVARGDVVQLGSSQTNTLVSEVSETLLPAKPTTQASSVPSPEEPNATATDSRGEQKAEPTTDLVLHSSAINSIDDDDYASSDYDAADNVGSSTGNTRSVSKRKRETTDLVEMSRSRELVPHPSNRVHSAVTTMTQSRELILPPDEFDVLQNRLRKMNECIDQCYRTLSSSDGILNEMHRQDVESDLQFYSSIKKRLQEQLVMTMHGF